MAIWIDGMHDPATGVWVISGRLPKVGRRLPPWKTFRTPDPDTWWQFVRTSDPDLAEVLRGDEVRRDFNDSIGNLIRSCYCTGCRKAADAGRYPLPGYRPKTGRALPPLTYAQARTRYMDTGTIADKEAMLACVTMTVPDLGTIGSDWEPAPRELHATASIGEDAPPRRRLGPPARVALASAAMLTVGLAVLVTEGIAAAGALLASALAGFLLAFTARQ